MAVPINFNGLADFEREREKSREKFFDGIKSIITHVYDLGYECGQFKGDYDISSISVIDLAMMAVVGVVDGARGDEQ